MTWLHVLADNDDEFANVLYRQLADFDSDGVARVTELMRYDGIIFLGDRKGANPQNLIPDGIDSRQVLIARIFSKLNGIELRDVAGTLEITLEGLKTGGPSGFWGLRWQIFLMDGKPATIGPFASHVHASATAQCTEPYAQTIYDYCCVLRGTRWFHPTLETDEERCIEKLPYLTLVGILERVRRSLSWVVEHGEKFEKLPLSEPRPAWLIEDGLRAAAMLKRLLLAPGAMPKRQTARVEARYDTEQLDFIIENLRSA